MSGSDYFYDLDYCYDTKYAEYSSDDESKSSQYSDSMNSLLYLVDDCVSKLFDYLDIESLCAMADTCKRFRRIARQNFGQRFTEMSCKISTETMFYRIIRNFGHLIKKMHPRDFSDFDTIDKYCPYLESVHITDNFDSDELQTLLKRIKNLEFYIENGDKAKNDLLINCPELESLTFYGQDYYECQEREDPPFGVCSCNWDFVIQPFPKLKSLKVHPICGAEDITYKMLRLNPQLKELSTTDHADDYHIAKVLENTKQLERLAFLSPSTNRYSYEQTKEGFLKLSKLKTLKALTIVLSTSCNRYKTFTAPLVDAFFNEKVLIEELELRNFVISSEDIKSILNLKTLNKICLQKISYTSEDDLVTLPTQLPLLNSLKLDFGFSQGITLDCLVNLVKAGKQLEYIELKGMTSSSIKQEIFDILLQEIQVREEKRNLTICIEGRKCTLNIDVPPKLQKSNSKPLKIDVSADKCYDSKCGICYPNGK